MTEEYLERLEREFGFIHLNMDQVFENEVQRGT
jgi:hypothetical protein